MLSAFNAVGVAYLVVSARSVAALRAPRATGNLDNFVRRDKENSKRVRRALLKSGAPTARLSSDDFAAPDAIVQFGVPPNCIDILTSIDCVGFYYAWRNRVAVEIDDVAVTCVGLDDLVANKRATGPAKDRADVQRLERIRNAKPAGNSIRSNRRGRN